MAGISPQSINYVYTDESKCPVRKYAYIISVRSRNNQHTILLSFVEIEPDGSYSGATNPSYMNIFFNIRNQYGDISYADQSMQLPPDTSKDFKNLPNLSSDIYTIEILNVNAEYEVINKNPYLKPKIQVFIRVLITNQVDSTTQFPYTVTSSQLVTSHLNFEVGAFRYKDVNGNTTTGNIVGDLPINTDNYTGKCHLISTDKNTKLTDLNTIDIISPKTDDNYIYTITHTLV